MHSFAHRPPPVQPARPPVRPVKSFTDFTLHTTNGLHTLEIGSGRRSKWYHLEAVPSAWGRAFRLDAAMGDKLARGDEYHVLLAGRESSCSCDGCQWTGSCKHLCVLLALVAEGRLS
jgi:hypothetical protein